MYIWKTFVERSIKLAWKRPALSFLSWSESEPKPFCFILRYLILSFTFYFIYLFLLFCGFFVIFLLYINYWCHDYYKRFFILELHKRLRFPFHVTSTCIYIYIYIYTKDFIVPFAATLHRLRYEYCKIGHWNNMLLLCPFYSWVSKNRDQLNYSYFIYGGCY